MKSLLIGVISAMISALVSTSSFAAAGVSCENDKICADTQVCKDGYCVEKAGLSTHSNVNTAKPVTAVPNTTTLPKKVTPAVPTTK